MSTQKERLLEFKDRLGISTRQFERSIGMSNGTIKNIKGLSENLLARVFEEYPMLNKTWLYTGEGSMICSLPGQEVNLDLSHHNASDNSVVVDGSSGSEVLLLREKVSTLKADVARLASEREVLQKRIDELTNALISIATNNK